MKTPFISTYYNLFNDKRECTFLSLISCENDLKDNNNEKLINKIKNIDYFIIYTEDEFNKLSEYNDIFLVLLSLKKIFYITYYNEDLNDFLLKYDKHINLGLRIGILNTKISKNIYNLSNKVVCLYIEGYTFDIEPNIMHYLPNSCKIIDIDNIKEYKILNLPNKLVILNSFKSINLKNKIKLPKNTCLIFCSHLLNEHSYYSKLFKNNSNKIIIDYFQDICYDNDNNFSKKILFKKNNMISVVKITGKTIKIDTGCDNVTSKFDSLYTCSEIKDFLQNNTKYYWTFSTNSLVDVLSVNYHIVFAQDKHCIKLIKINKNSDFSQLLIDD
jgi:hypothetical protein